MRLPLKVALIAGAAIVALIAVLATIPLLFGDRMTAGFKRYLNDATDARIAWRGVDVSLLRDFPNVSLTVTGLSVAGVRRFQGDTLLTVRQSKLVLDLGSVVGYLRRGAPIVVRDVALDQPVLRLRRLADGTANW